MELSYSHRFVFIHIYRTAGSSVAEALKPFSYDPAEVPLLKEPIKRFKTRRWLSYDYGHMRAKELKRALRPQMFDQFYKFAFVRNPWDWQVSIYHKALQYPTHHDNEFFKSLGSFDRYLDWRIREKGPELQTDFVLGGRDEVLLDLIGRYEAVTRDFATACSEIGVQCTLPHKNESRHTDYTDYYTAETQALVAEAYRKDIEFLGYEFGAQDPLPPIVR
jgi:hypothetical protein